MIITYTEYIVKYVYIHMKYVVVLYIQYPVVGVTMLQSYDKALHT